MKDLLTKCGFSVDEIDTHLPRMQRACRKFHITEDDVRNGNQRLERYFAVELEGIRKLLRLVVLEFMDSTLAREEGKSAILSGFMAPGMEIIGSAVVNHSNQAYSSHQSWALLMVMGSIFDKLTPLMEAAEKKWLKAGMVAHCGNVKALVGSVLLDLIPKPDLLVTAGFMCETAPKTLDLLHEIHNIPVACFDTCLDRSHADYARAVQRTMDMAAKSMRALVAKVNGIVGFEITDDMLLAVLEGRKPVNALLGKIAELTINSDPMPLSATHIALWMCLNALTMNRQRLFDAEAALEVLYGELLERVEKGQGPVKKGAPRILAILPGQHADPRFEHLVEEVGMAIVAVDVDLFVDDAVPTGRDPYVMMCRGLAHSLITSLPERIPLIIDACRRLKVDGLLNRYHVGCRSVAGDAFVIDAAVKKQLGLPVLLLEWENFDPRAFDYPEYRKRLEVFKSMME